MLIEKGGGQKPVFFFIILFFGTKADVFFSLHLKKKKKVSFSFSFSVRRRHLRPEHSTHPFTFMMGTGFKITTHFREGFCWTNMYSSLAYIINYFILHGICALKLSGILF